MECALKTNANAKQIIQELTVQFRNVQMIVYMENVSKDNAFVNQCILAKIVLTCCALMHATTMVTAFIRVKTHPPVFASPVSPVKTVAKPPVQTIAITMDSAKYHQNVPKMIPIAPPLNHVNVTQGFMVSDVRSPPAQIIVPEMENALLGFASAKMVTPARIAVLRFAKTIVPPMGNVSMENATAILDSSDPTVKRR